MSEYQRAQRVNAQRAKAAAVEQRRQEREVQRQQREREREEKAEAKRREQAAHDATEAQAAQRTEQLSAKVRTLESLLVDSLDDPVAVSFERLRKTPRSRRFEPPRELTQSASAPAWEDYDPPPPGPVGVLFGGRARHERRLSSARERYEQDRRRHEADEDRRRKKLDQRRREHEQCQQQERAAAARHNAAVDEVEARYRAGDPDAVCGHMRLALDRCRYPQGFPSRLDLAYRPEPKELWIEIDLPAQDIVPAVRGYQYVKSRRETKTLSRPQQEVKRLYRDVIAQTSLRRLRECFAASDRRLVDTVVFNGRVTTRDKATGKPVRPCLVSLSCDRDVFDELELRHLSPADCLAHLNALVSPHPYDLEAVEPVVEFDLSRFRFGDEYDAASELDGRADLIEMDPFKFEHLVKQLFEAHERMQGFTTVGSRDDGIDAVVTNTDPVVGGLCVIQAKRYKKVVPADAVRSLAGAMEDKRAGAGILVTTSWFGSSTRDFAKRHGRIRLIEGAELKHLIEKYLHKNVRIGLPKQPPRRKPDVS
ncbi:MAG: restriction endonuclease [Stackebrandtia sp.]